MIVFDLICSHGHVFEGWFASGEAFESQQKGKLVRCPACDDWHVARRPSARVHVRKGEAAVDEPEKPEAPEAIAGMPADLVAKLREIVKKTEDVGERFPEEARKIHYEEAPKRAIRGKASKAEADALTEEGIEFSQLPPFLTRDTH
ncbi:MAG TPA: DUF1178 family protein [Casimicrobiaceae bacterium]|nr:DUF1178 family protein [Casimicrobiaceae bacterium]